MGKKDSLKPVELFKKRGALIWRERGISFSCIVTGFLFSSFYHPVCVFFSSLFLMHMVFIFIWEGKGSLTVRLIILHIGTVVLLKISQKIQPLFFFSSCCNN